VRVGGLGGGDGRPDDFLARLEAWSAADRVARSASERSRTRSLLDRSASDATWAGLLVDLAEAAAEVTVSMGGGRRLTGRLVGTARDFVVMERRRSGPVLIRSAAVRAVTPSADAAGPARPAGRRTPPRDMSLAGALDALAGEQAPVTLRAGDDTFAGTVVACGEDVVTIRADGGRSPVYVPLAGLDCVELR
jgi:hypothetical protein